MCAFIFYPALYYIKMLLNSSKNNKKHFAKAYKCFGRTSVIVYGTYVLYIVICMFAFVDTLAAFAKKNGVAFWSKQA